MVVGTRVSSGGSVEGCCGFPIWQDFICTCMFSVAPFSESTFAVADVGFHEGGFVMSGALARP